MYSLKGKVCFQIGFHPLENKMNIIGRRKIWYLISLILLTPGIIAMIVWGIPFGIDFKGGTLLEIQFSQSVSKDTIIEATKNLDIKNINVLPSGEDNFIIRTGILDDSQQKNLIESLNKAGDYKQNRFETVGPAVSNDLRNKAVIAVIIASIAIIFYIAIAFRKVPKPTTSWRFGICAVLALIHDVLFVVGMSAILGHFFGYEVDALFITAILTIMGFSVHDTIVVFDRIRENLRKSPSLDFEENVNNSILQTINRSLNTSFTVLIVLFSLYLLGGDTLKHFMLILLIGIAIGTYSSIFNAPPLLVSWHRWSMRRASKNVSS
ncbi:MAG: Protein translocase subunit SecF [Berkelbacteria bacterium GW2011_GWA1_39_10]|uniref:Protein-export membrane protein SecF n=2 Tax=Candidatus Berkelbacteria TaxID=1618330 RepID=A0A0G0LF78_9BACT|nr:MAG: Protein translocase subunit SecF [Berkelbacteria bacterium GW2011_GWA1_39_10]